MLSKWEHLKRMCFRLLASFKFIAGPETEGLVQLAQSLLALSGDVKEYLIWHIRRRNLFIQGNIMRQMATRALGGLLLML